jgi:hypothetical protein
LISPYRRATPRLLDPDDSVLLTTVLPEASLKRVEAAINVSEAVLYL